MKELKELEKELSKLRNRGAIGISIFCKECDSIKNCAKEAILVLKSMKREKTKIV